MKDEIEVAEHPRWVPVPLDQDPETTRQHWESVAEGADDPAGVGALMASVVRQLQAADDPEVLPLAAWALLEPTGALDVSGFAMLRLMPVEETTDEDSVVRDLVSATPVFSDPVIGSVETRSGPAVSVRMRPMVEVDGRQEVHHLTTVLWVRASHQALFSLSYYGTQLTDSLEGADLLEELAAGVDGL